MNSFIKSIVLLVVLGSKIQIFSLSIYSNIRNYHDESLNSFIYINIYQSGLELDLTMKGLLIFLILVVFIVIVILVYIYRNKKRQEEEESNKKQKIKEKGEHDINDELRKFRNMKIDNVIRQVLEDQNKEKIENDRTKDEGQVSCRNFIDKLNDISSVKGKYLESIKDLRHKDEDENNSELKIIKKSSSLKSNHSKMSIKEFIKNQAQKHISQYDSDNRSTPESSIYIEEITPNKKEILNKDLEEPKDKDGVEQKEVIKKKDLFDTKEIKLNVDNCEKIDKIEIGDTPIMLNNNKIATNGEIPQ